MQYVSRCFKNLNKMLCIGLIIRTSEVLHEISIELWLGRWIDIGFQGSDIQRSKHLACHNSVKSVQLPHVFRGHLVSEKKNKNIYYATNVMDQRPTNFNNKSKDSYCVRSFYVLCCVSQPVLSCVAYVHFSGLSITGLCIR